MQYSFIGQLCRFFKIHNMQYTRPHTQVDFKKYDYKVGDNVIINFNPCSAWCNCFYMKEFAPCLEENKKYEIEGLTHFGGGCPPLFLKLKGIEVPDNKFDWGFPANWFKPI